MKISGASCLVLCVAVVIAMLAGCSSSPNVTPMLSGAFAQNTTQVDRSTDPGFVDLRRPHSETLKGSGTGRDPCVNHAGGDVTLNASGKARGLYRGKFTGSAGFEVGCHSGATNIGGRFTITSGPHTITGSFSGSGTYQCSPVRDSCEASSQVLAYTASIGGDPVSGSASGTFIAYSTGGGWYGLILNRL